MKSMNVVVTVDGRDFGGVYSCSGGVVEVQSAWGAKRSQAGASAQRTPARRLRGNRRDNAAALVWTNAPHIISAFDEGTLIKAANGAYLAIPTEHAPKRIFYRPATPARYEQAFGRGRLKMVRTPSGTIMLVDHKLRARQGKRGGYTRLKAGSRSKAESVPMFWLVPQVGIAKRLDLARDVRAWSGRIPALIVESWIDERL